MAGVTDDALPSVLIDLVLHNTHTPVQFICFEDGRALSHTLNEVEALLGLPFFDHKQLETAEFPALDNYRHLDSVLLDKQCDVIRTLSLIEQSLKNNHPLLIFTTPEALLQNLPRESEISGKQVVLEVGKETDFNSFKDALAEQLGYAYEAVCEQPGQFSVRGGLIDVYPINELTPYRIDFFGDEVDSIKSFDPTTQLTENEYRKVSILPAIDTDTNSGSDSHTLITSYLKAPCTWYLRSSKQIEIDSHRYFSTPERIRDADDRKMARLWLDRACAKSDQWFALDELAEPSSFFQKETPDTEPSSTSLADWVSRQVFTESDATDEEAALRQSEIQMLRKLHQAGKDGFHIVVGVSKPDEKERYENLANELFGKTPHLKLCVASLPKGIVFHNHRNAFFPGWLGPKSSKGAILVSEADLHPYLRIRLGRKKQRKAVEISQVDQMLDFTELSDGDYLVHQQHGICIFRGIHVLDFSSNRESLSLEFADGSMLHVPLTETHQLTRYVGLSKRTPKLGKLGSSQWEKDRKAAEKATLELAAELLALQARRDTVQGYSYPPDDEWMKQFEKAFPYNETPDQLTAIHQCKHDMELPRPMDRLICGDVGFGKTEVAMRAAFKALEAGKQVAVLVPTTVLCQQHFHSFKERMAPFPVTIETVSGFRTAGEQRNTLHRLATGQVDCIVGTHRLLSQDVNFHDLGLIIIDEEHRFGVKQKEKLKQIATTVDVLTLSATPIPRTLYMALAGARDLSVIETPPRNRLPIETVVRNYTHEIVDAAIRTEIARGGQVFYLHNRVSSIDRVAAEIQERNPNLKVVVGHGQMERNDLELIMTRFVEGEFDVMVCTTIH